MIYKNRIGIYSTFIDKFLKDVGIIKYEILGIKDNPKLPNLKGNSIKVIPFTEQEISNSEFIHKRYTYENNKGNEIAVSISFENEIEDEKVYLYFYFKESKNTRKTSVEESDIDKKIRMDKKAKEQETVDLLRMKDAGYEQTILY